MTGVLKLDKTTLEMFEEVDKMIERNYPIDHRECIKKAVRQFVPEYELVDIYALYGITYEQYIEDMAKSYLRYKSQKVSDMWRNSIEY